MACVCSASDLTAILEKEHLGRVILAIIESNRAVAPDVIGAHAAARAPAVHLMDAELIPQIERAPGFHKKGVTRLRREQLLQRWSFHFARCRSFTRKTAACTVSRRELKPFIVWTYFTFCP